MPERELSLTSPAFEHNGLMPQKYTADGDNISPPLHISGVPSSAASLALIMDDPDAATGPGGSGHAYVHWVVFNISPDMIDFPEGGLPPSVMVGNSTSGKPGYVGPAPPSGEHRYFFKLYALSDIIDASEDIGADDLMTRIKPLILASTELVGRYSRLTRAE